MPLNTEKFRLAPATPITAGAAGGTPDHEALVVLSAGGGAHV
eukprot:CAMPEP_0114164656 /NCGR_PEP_ID=MMETSP0043_2-20121206/30788_1 /TAXON_ID=464988 /ORGANISM="Hemiselmis andersenii, Strain CCMP644" /LENGTH=41 /DNA_ID= /DNA_START= /DNA_END= /DNA_ORIENTATION=